MQECSKEWTVCGLLGGGGALEATVGSEGPVLPRAGPEGTLLGVLADLHLEGLLVALLVLVGRQIHAWERERGRRVGVIIRITPLKSRLFVKRRERNVVFDLP